MGYKRIFKYLRVFLVYYPFFYWVLIIGLSCDGEGDSCKALDHIPAIANFFLITYIFGIVLILGLFGLYTLFLITNKVKYNIKQSIRKYCKNFKIKKKKIGKYPIIIQYTPPRGLTPMEVSYLYNLRHFKGNISCLFYKWAAEKRISMDFKQGNILSFDKIVIKAIDSSLENMSEDEQYQRDLIFGQDKEITLPNIDILRKIPAINIYTAKSCFDKKFISIKFSIKLTAKNVSGFLAILGIVSIFLLLFTAYAISFLKFGIPPRILLIEVAFSIIMIFWSSLTEMFYEKKKLTYYKLSEKGKEILAEIYGFKYFLEACDEKKIKTFLEQDSEYLDKIMPYAVALGVETQIVDSISPDILDGINSNRYLGDLSSLAKAMVTSSERAILFSTEKLDDKKSKKNKKDKKTANVKKNFNNKNNDKSFKSVKKVKF